MDVIEEKGVDPCLMDQVMHDTQLHVLVCFKMVLCILQNGFQSIHLAAAAGMLNIVKVLVEKYKVSADSTTLVSKHNTKKRSHSKKSYSNCAINSLLLPILNAINGRSTSLFYFVSKFCLSCTFCLHMSSLVYSFIGYNFVHGSSGVKNYY